MVSAFLSIDFTNPSLVVAGYIEAMNGWETETHKFHHKNRGLLDHKLIWKTTSGKLEVIFDCFCTKKDRPYGRNGSFQKPPEYDSKTEVIKSVNVIGRKASVETIREAILGDGRYKYVLQKLGDRWYIDNVKYYSGNRWVKAIL